MNIHPKILAAALGALAVFIVTIGNAIANVYPNASWLPFIAAAIPVIAGYLKTAAASPGYVPPAVTPAPPAK